jgi:hypothetical protein
MSSHHEQCMGAHKFDSAGVTIRRSFISSFLWYSTLIPSDINRQVRDVPICRTLPTPMEPRSHRIYASTVIHKITTGYFLVAIILQLGLALLMTYLAVKHPGACHSFGYVTQPALYFGTLSRHLWHLRQMWGYSFPSRTAWFAPPTPLQDTQTIAKDAGLHILLLCSSNILFVCLTVLDSACTMLIFRNV